MRKAFTSYLYFLLIIVIGVAVVILANCMEPSRFSRVAEVVGTTVIVTGLASAFLDYILYRRVTYKYFKLLEGANRAGIINIFPDRETALKEIKELIPLARKEVNLMGVSLTDFMSPEFRRNIDNFVGSNLGIRVLFLNWSSDAAKERARREEGEKDIGDTQLYADIRTCQRFFEDLERRLTSGDKLKLEYKMYKDSPSMLIVNIDDQMFYEPYHLGVEKEEVSPFARCLGKRIPVIQVDKGSRAFNIMKSHFEYVWRNSTKRDDSI